MNNDYKIEEVDALVDALKALLRAYQTVHGDGDLEMQPAIYQANKVLANVGGGK